MNMKTKYLISALALPALLAACVNDDFETQQLPSSTVESDLLKGRAMGELMLSAQKVGYGEQTDTRVDGGMEGASGGINWWWQPGDQLGAASAVAPGGLCGSGLYQLHPDFELHL